jgi:hypothetical protein
MFTRFVLFYTTKTPLTSICTPIFATTLFDSLFKHFKTIDFKEKEVVVIITLLNNIIQFDRDRAEDSVLFAYKIQPKLVDMYIKYGWQVDDSLQVDPIDAGVIELIT